MKDRIYKIKAFSLQEMMVVLIITSVVVGMAFAVLNLVQRQMNGIQNIYEVKNDIVGMRQSLWMDFSKANSVYYDSKRQELYFNNGMEERKYSVRDSLLVGTNVELAIETIEFYFENQKVTQGEVDALSIKTTKDTGNAEIFVFKRNTPTTYMNLR
ncbi:PulJ/GspJ family protein [Maribacter flavus]|uniref:Prepilin-type N-terminal cleavage/methylation domain-containing protein n=1 Tax=Maribacter flavus TaxID=1658664 RepID=A0A5B2TR64_9FLAO|nr:hypothetical protein [Maribacter flavus]KAA2216573.1 hypothetical protein F0361_11250 [Maribacter flavus]